MASCLGNLTEPTVLLAIFGIIVTIALVAKKVPAGVFVGMIITAIVGLICGAFGLEGMPTLPSQIITTDFEMVTLGAFVQGFADLFSDPFNCFVVIFSFLFVDFFDTDSFHSISYPFCRIMHCALVLKLSHEKCIYNYII